MNQTNTIKTRPEPELAALDGEWTAAACRRPAAEEFQELKDRLLRTLADMENLRQRTQREVEDARKFAVTGFARDLLEVGDNLGRALASVPADARQQSELHEEPGPGRRDDRALAAERPWRSIRSAGSSRSKGEKFDHKLHQAMFEVPTNELARRAALPR